MHFTPKPHLWSIVTAGLIVGLLYSTHLILCQRSTLRYMDASFVNSDPHANLQWAKSIREQGWLNPRPYHPWTDWMQAIAPYPQWVDWWGGEQIYQQSPLYAYVLALFLDKLLLMRVTQALMSIGTCVFIAFFTARICGRVPGWIAFGLSALYAPFYAYSWPFMRDDLSWLITAALLWGLSSLAQAPWPSARASRMSWCVGILLGLGFLTRETYLLIIPAAFLTLACFAWRRMQWRPVIEVMIACILVLSPLIVRNWLAKAPLLSTSNRLSETIIHGNAGTSRPNELSFPPETGRIMYETRARPWPVFVATIASHQDGFMGWMRLQVFKFLSLLDPYEPPDNLSFYFVATISPVVRFGLRYWMILPLALAGLYLSIRRRERKHIWIWIFLPLFGLSLFVGVPLSRYRQSLAVLFIPLAAYLLASLNEWLRRRDFRKAIFCGAAIVVAWILVLGPLSRQPRALYERPAEYIVSANIYHQLGDEQRARAMIDFVRQRFPGALP